MITKKFAERLINHIFDIWDLEYVLHRLPELSVKTEEVHQIVTKFTNFSILSRKNKYEQCKKELFKLVLTKKVIIDV